MSSRLREFWRWNFTTQSENSIKTIEHSNSLYQSSWFIIRPLTSWNISDTFLLIYCRGDKGVSLNPSGFWNLIWNFEQEEKITGCRFILQVVELIISSTCSTILFLKRRIPSIRMSRQTDRHSKKLCLKIHLKVYKASNKSATLPKAITRTFITLCHKESNQRSSITWNKDQNLIKFIELNEGLLIEVN